MVPRASRGIGDNLRRRSRGASDNNTNQFCNWLQCSAARSACASAIVAVAGLAGVRDHGQRFALVRTVGADIPFPERVAQVAGVLAENAIFRARREQGGFDIAGQQLQVCRRTAHHR